MNKNHTPSNHELPTMGKLIKSTIMAIIVAAVLLITVILPAEYGIDPIGVGEVIGLTKMGKIKVSLAEEAALENETAPETKPAVQQTKKQVADPKSVPEPSGRKDTFTVTLDPNQGKEIKLTMSKGSTVNYLWYTDGDKANFDAHADSEKLEIKYHNYEKGKLKRSEGVMEAAFDGNHGWFWRNRTSEPMVVTLEVNGNYTDIVQY